MNGNAMRALAEKSHDLEPQIAKSASGHSVHRRQFIIGPRPHPIYSDWKTFPFINGCYISHCPNLHVQEVKDRDGCRWLILGMPLASNSPEQNAMQEIAESATEVIPRLSETWAGAWLLLNHECAYPDGGALLGCFYRRIFPQNGVEELWLSSSQRLLSQLPFARSIEPEVIMATRGFGLDFIPPPVTQYDGIYKQLPSQILSHKTGDIESLRQNLFTLADGSTADTIISDISRRLRNIAHHAQEFVGPEGRIRIALSAGFDSRTIAAAFRSAGVDFETYTFDNPPANSYADTRLPPLISKHLGVRHQSIRAQGVDEDIAAVFDDHTTGYYSGVERLSIPRGLYSQFRDNDLLVRGSGCQHTCCFYWWAIADDFDWFAPDAPAKLIRNFGNLPNSQLEGRIEAAIAWMKEAPFENIDLRDRFAWDARLGGWGSDTYHAVSIAAPASIEPLNCVAVNRGLLALPAEQRDSRDVMRQILAHLAPELLQFPINPPDPPMFVVSEFLKKLLTIQKEKGIASVGSWLANGIKRRFT